MMLQIIINLNEKAFFRVELTIDRAEYKVVSILNTILIFSLLPLLHGEKSIFNLIKAQCILYHLAPLRLAESVSVASKETLDIAELRVAPTKAKLASRSVKSSRHL